MKNLVLALALSLFPLGFAVAACTATYTEADVRAEESREDADAQAEEARDKKIGEEGGADQEDIDEQDEPATEGTDL